MNNTYFVRYNRANRDYDAFRMIDGREEYVGSSSSYSAALALASWGNAE